jgi:hypothetical protein
MCGETFVGSFLAQFFQFFKGTPGSANAAVPLYRMIGIYFKNVTFAVVHRNPCVWLGYAELKKTSTPLCYNHGVRRVPSFYLSCFLPAIQLNADLEPQAQQ